MIIIKIIGGLGNQMFQYAYAKTLGNQGFDVKIDISEFKRYKLHDGYQLDKYNIILDESIKKENDFFYKKNVFRKIKNKLGINSNKIIKEQTLEYDNNLLQIKDNNYIEGYFQNERYFFNIRDELLNDFSIKADLSLYSEQIEKNILDEEVSASIHIRRGDYISNENTNKVHGCCDLGYYKKAISIMNEKYKGIRYFIFSDDIDWVKENLKIKKAIYIDSEEKRIPHEDIYLMSLCSHNIIANSSFSWWGAWLNTNDKKTVIAPKRWFLNKNLEEQSKNIVCTDWVKL